MKLTGSLLAVSLLASPAAADDIGPLLFTSEYASAGQEPSWLDQYDYVLVDGVLKEAYRIWCPMGIDSFEYLTAEEAVRRGLIQPSEIGVPITAPEPAAAALLGLGGLCLLRGRRRL